MSLLAAGANWQNLMRLFRDRALVMPLSTPLDVGEADIETV